MQLLSALLDAPPLSSRPPPVAELPVSVQLFRTLPYAPPPTPHTQNQGAQDIPPAWFPHSVQLLSVPPEAPPPLPAELPPARLPDMKQLVTTAFHPHDTPPPP